jgi:hypothetical protein
MEQSADTQPPSSFLSSAISLAWQALWLQKKAYTAILESKISSRRGFSILMLVLLIAAIATSLGLALDRTTMPQADQLQQQLYSAIANSQLYLNKTAQSPGFSTLFTVIYNLLWLVLRMTAGYPSGPYLLLGFLGVFLNGIFIWFTYAFLVNLIAPRMGGKAPRGAIWGTMALAFSPQLLLALNLIPGLVVPTSLISAWTIACAYQAIRATYDFSPQRSMGLIILAYVLNIILIFLALVFGVLVGVLGYKLLFQ